MAALGLVGDDGRMGFSNGVAATPAIGNVFTGSGCLHAPDDHRR